MKQKVVIKVSMNGQKSRSKALKKVVGVQGVEAAALQGQDKIEVTGESMDVIGLTTSLRKSVGYAELVSVTPVGEKKEGDKKDGGGGGGGGKKSETPVPIVWPYPPYVTSVPEYYMYPVREYDNNCSIM
ncbi:unnamed protein product [Camellia sinensis]